LHSIILYKMNKRGTNLSFPLKGRYVAMLAPSFVVDFSYPKIISQLKSLGFDKIVELTFGAKMINRDYHKKLEKSKELVISTVCPGIVETIKEKFPKYKKNLIQVDSPMAAMAKICKRTYPQHKVVFISPCNFKKIEVQKSKYADYVIDYKELNELLKTFKGRLSEKNREVSALFDKFYNDYTKIYPLSGGLSKTAHVKEVLRLEETKIIDGIDEVLKFLNNPDKKIKFLDATFCKGGCIGGPCIASKLPLSLRKKKVLDYMKIAEKEKIPENRKGTIKEAKGISFKTNF
jgi:iron only hydrogenase large subunit-like protein